MNAMERSSLIRDFKSIHPLDLSVYDGQSDFDILRVPLDFNVADLQSRLKRVQAENTWLTKDTLQGYEALGLQYSDLAQQFTDAVDATSNYESVPGESYPKPKMLRDFRFYEKLNSAGRVFEPVFDRLTPIRLFRSRLLSAHAGFDMPRAHVDGDVSVRLHIPIETNPEAWMEIEGRRYHMPADGSGYLVNTARLHRIGNLGSSTRTHIVSVIYRRFPGHLHRLAQSSLIRFIEGPLGGLVKKLREEHEVALRRAQGRCERCHTERTLYGVPTPARELKALCAPCIEDIGRRIASTLGPFETAGDRAVDQFETKVESEVETGLELARTKNPGSKV